MRLALLALCLVLVGCSGEPMFDRDGAYMMENKAELQRQNDRDTGSITEGDCRYVIARGYRSISIVHAGDCPNPIHGQSAPDSMTFTEKLSRALDADARRGGWAVSQTEHGPIYFIPKPEAPK